MKIVGIIPARFSSSRFEGKPLASIAGKTMIQRVYEQCAKSKRLDEVVVATDDERIYDKVKNFSKNVIMTSMYHTNGTERCNEIAQTMQADFFINIQGDEPFLNPNQIDLLANKLTKEVEICTLIKKITHIQEIDDPNVVKVVIDQSQKALYFSRSCIPYVRDKKKIDWLKQQDFYKHIGIYAYRYDVLKKIVKLSPSKLEKSESLEQLRWLENGFDIWTDFTEYETIGIDTPENIETALKLYKNTDL